MKKYYFLLLFLSIGLSSCSEQVCCVLPEEPTLIGTWKLDKLCFSNGASSCNEEDMWDAEEEEILTFTEDGTFSFNKEGEICSGTYLREGEMDVKLTATGGNCNFDETTFWLSKLELSEMIFSPRCIEGCPHLYVKQ